MNIPCPRCEPCELVNLPYTNLSAEGPDRVYCIGSSWGSVQRRPLLGSDWTSSDCYRTCEFTLSKEEVETCAVSGIDLCSGQCNWLVSTDLATACADNLANQCNNSCPPNDPNCTNPSSQCNPNTPQTGIAVCPDGTQFSFTVQAGMFCEDSLAQANAEALSLAQQQAALHRFCLSPLSGCICFNVPYSARVVTDNPGLKLTWFIASGQLPPGLVLEPPTTNVESVVIAGRPTHEGTYSFGLAAVAAGNAVAQRIYTITVIRILTTSLPNYTVGEPYSYQLVASGGSGNYAWKIESGTLPAGLTLSASGLISGTPT